MHVMCIFILGHVKLVTKNQLHADASLGREITFLCDNLVYIDGTTWCASRRDLMSCGAPRSTPAHQLNPAIQTGGEGKVKFSPYIFLFFVLKYFNISVIFRIFFFISRPPGWLFLFSPGRQEKDFFFSVASTFFHRGLKLRTICSLSSSDRL